MILDGWSAGNLFLLTLAVAASAFVVLLLAAQVRTGAAKWIRIVAAPLAPLMVFGLLGLFINSPGQAKTGTVMMCALAGLLFLSALSSAQKTKGAGRILIVVLGAAPVISAIVLAPGSMHSLGQAHDDMTRLHDRDALVTARSLPELEKQYFAANGRFATASELPRGGEARLLDVPAPQGQWALAVVAKDCRLCRSYYVDSSGALRFAEGRRADPSDPIASESDNARIEHAMQPKPSGP